MIDTNELDEWHSNFVGLYMDKLATTVDHGGDNDEGGKKRKTRGPSDISNLTCASL